MPAYGELCLQLVELVSQYVDLPVVDLPEYPLPEDVTGEVAAEAAALVRARWQLEAGPVPSVVRLLEAHGVVVLRLPSGTDRRVDAFSTFSGSRPLVFLSAARKIGLAEDSTRLTSSGTSCFILTPSPARS